MRLSHACGITYESPNADHLRVMKNMAVNYLRAMGSMSLAEFAEQDPHEIACLVSAGNEIRTDMAVATGIASHGPGGAAMVNSTIDGGEALIRHEMMEISDAVVARFHDSGRTT